MMVCFPIPSDRNWLKNLDILGRNCWFRLRIAVNNKFHKHSINDLKRKNVRQMDQHTDTPSFRIALLKLKKDENPRRIHWIFYKEKYSMSLMELQQIALAFITEKEGPSFIITYSVIYPNWLWQVIFVDELSAFSDFFLSIFNFNQLCLVLHDF